MRLLVVGKLNGQLAVAVKMAMATGAKVSHVESVAAATHALRAGQGADLLMVDYELDIAGLITANEAERISVPVVACGVAADARRAADASTRRQIEATGVTVTGYPSSREAPISCTNRPTAHSRTQQRIECPDFTGGTSGSPWVNGDGQVVGVLGGHEQGGLTPDVSYSVVLGAEAAALYRDAVC